MRILSSYILSTKSIHQKQRPICNLVNDPKYFSGRLEFEDSTKPPVRKNFKVTLR